jgi:hypothetical protein
VCAEAKIRKKALTYTAGTDIGNGRIVLTFHIQILIQAHTDSHTHEPHTSTRGRKHMYLCIYIDR